MKAIKMKSLFGNLMPQLLLLAVTGFLCGPAAGQGGEGAVPQADFSGLKAELQRHGWRVEQSPEGDLLLWAPSAEADAGRRPVKLKQVAAPEGEQIAATDIDRLQKKLGESGWVVQRDESGGLLVRRPGDVPAETAKVANAGGDGQLDDLRALLGASGWRVTKDEGGDLLLYPRPEEEKETAAVEKGVDVRLSDRVGLKSALTTAGWKVVERRDGTLLLYPRSGESKDEAPSPGLVADGKVNLPVDTWTEARDIAKWWLDQNAAGAGLMIGKVRKVNWVYLISIVEKASPFRLNNQLVIREQDGTVVPLY